MPTNSILLTEKALSQLTRFCNERSNGKSGKLHWDAFLVHAYREPLPPLAADLYSWLQENLKGNNDHESLVDDYQRFGELLNQWQNLAKAIRPPIETVNASLVCKGAADEISGPRDSSIAMSNQTVASGPAEIWSPEHTSNLLILGRRNTGKTCLMTQMVTRDIDAGDRVIVVIDTDGSLCSQVRCWIEGHDSANEISKRVIDIDSIARSQSGFSFDPLQVPDGADYFTAASSVVMAFKAICADHPGSQILWNQQTANILRNSVMLLMASGKTLADLPTLLTTNDFRDLLLMDVEKRQHDNPELTVLMENWQQYKKLARTDQWINWIEPILSSLQAVLGNPRLRAILTTSGNNLDIKEIILQRKILLVNVERFHRGALLGGLIVTALKRCAEALNEENGRTNTIALYLDGLKNIVDHETIQGITERTKKLRFSLIAAENSLSTLFPANICSRLADDFGNIASFSLDGDDAHILAPMFVPSMTRLPAGLVSGTADRLTIDMLVRQEPGTFYLHEPSKGYSLSKFKTRPFSTVV